MNKLQKTILKTGKIDALSLAEKITRESYKDDKVTESLGCMLHLKKGEEMRSLLSKADDTQFSNTVEDYLRITGKFGFEVVYKEPFINDSNVEENLYVLFMKELGIIICFDTFSWENGKKANVNGGHMYYNWSPNSFNLRGELTSSGGFYFEKDAPHIGLFHSDLITEYVIPDYPADVKWTSDLSYEQFKLLSKPIEEKQKSLIASALNEGKRMLWVGYHDCREGVITTIKAMWENGKFFPTWQKCPFNWLTHYIEHKNTNHKYPFTEYYEITKKRISCMPEDVKNCINNTYKP